MSKRGITTEKISKETKASLEILIHEIQEILSNETEACIAQVMDIQKLLRTWIEANDLHPEQVEHLTTEEFRRRFR